MAKLEMSSMHLAIDKSNSRMVITVGVAAFVIIFSLFGSKTLWTKHTYLSRVTNATTIARNQLQSNIQAYSELVENYSNFESQTTNVIGGASSGTGTNQGDNAQIVLDALPDQYDFPALTSSLEKILKGQGFTISSITGTDDSATEDTTPVQDGASYIGSPSVTEMPFSFTVTGTNYAAIQTLFNTLQHSIRPLQIDSVIISGGEPDLNLTVDAHSYFQSGKTVNIKQETVK